MYRKSTVKGGRRSDVWLFFVYAPLHHSTFLGEEERCQYQRLRARIDAPSEPGSSLTPFPGIPPETLGGGQLPVSSAPTAEQKLLELGFDRPMPGSRAECGLPASIWQVMTKLRTVLDLPEDQTRVNSTKAAFTPDGQAWLLVGLRSNLTPALIAFRRCHGHRMVRPETDRAILDALDRVRSKCGKVRHAVLSGENAAWSICLRNGEDMLIVETM